MRLITVASDLLPPVLWAFAVAAHTYAILKHGTTKGNPMSEALDPNAPIPTAPVQAAPAPVAVNPVVTAVVQATQATQPPHNWATTAATVLSGLASLEQPAFQLTRSSSQTQMAVGLSIAALETVLSAFFPHPQGA